MKRFTQQYNELITGMISCFDRILFKGYLPLGWGDSMEGLLAQQGLRQGLVCVMRAVEPCQSFKLVPGEGRPRLVAARRKCLCFYFYFLDPKLGLVHVRIQSWFPLAWRPGQTTRLLPTPLHAIE